MSVWIALHIGNLSAVDDAGPTMSAFRSPFDIPTAMRGIHDEPSKRFRLEFRYLSGDERTKEVTTGGAVCHLGVHSGRIYAIDLDLAQTVDANAQALRSAFKRLEQQYRRSARNYEAAEKAVAEHQEELLLAAI